MIKYFAYPVKEIPVIANDGMTSLHKIKTESTVSLIVAFVLSGLFFSCQESKPSLEENEIVVEAPFEMPGIIVPNFTNAPRYPITEFGAEAANKEKNTRAIKKAVEKANSAGGGSVIIPKGEWLTGKVHLKSNVNLHLDEGAVLLFSDVPEDYLPPVRSTWEGMECYNYSPLIYAFKAKNVAITGKGELRAKMDTWEKWFDRPSGHMENLKRLYNMAAKDVPVEQRQMVNDSANFRPQFIQFNRCNNILIEGVSIKNSPFWVLHPFMSRNVIIRNINVYAHGHNNDGVDPEMSQNILIENCVFDQGDDAIAIKAGRNQDAWRLNTPAKNIVIRNCLVKNGHQLVAIGSELSGGVENVLVENCEVEDGAKLNHLLFIKTNERRGGYVKNVYMKNIKAGKIDKGILGIETDVLYQWRNLVPTYERRLTRIRDIQLEEVVAKEVKFISKIDGEEELPVENILLKNVSASVVKDSLNMHEHVLSFYNEE
ncbi:glycoside hydrolase family 28 protein [Gramella sp. MAR_2010_147]|uniref:glycoside hydrolase family 28 protein n=1 Tax=Gramella sp. MAR_2010_147 TaxID=1250205 RepID=UPI00087A936B|nr:glycoside hydrolase family 28 protein [Gramella sp. MAR_2010_147]SDS64335.1 Pectate lyase superfamily protein [Gramella sp. MAR_2010_147]